jgi:hypothetical protein
VAVQVKDGKEWSAPIYGNGGSKIIDKEASGLYVNDEAVKMATTDALGTALKYLGVGADVYRGFNESKYTAPVPPQTTKQDVSPSQPTQTPLAPNHGANACPKCHVGKMIRSPKTGKIFCDKKCWLNK